jgi:hypothetical protein
MAKSIVARFRVKAINFVHYISMAYSIICVTTANDIGNGMLVHQEEPLNSSQKIVRSEHVMGR